MEKYGLVWGCSVTILDGVCLFDCIAWFTAGEAEGGRRVCYVEFKD